MKTKVFQHRKTRAREYEISRIPDNIKLWRNIISIMPKSHGIKRKSRHIFTKGNASRGLSHLLINYSVGDKVVVVIDPREHRTTPHRRFQGRTGYIKDIGRRTVKVGILVGDKQKLLQTKFNHIRPIK